MSCLSRIGCLTVVALAGAGAWWLYGGSIPGITLPTGRTAERAGTSPRIAQRAVAWTSLEDVAPNSVVESMAILAKLAQPTGPAYVTLTAPEVASVLRGGLASVLPEGATGAQIAIDDDLIRVRAAVPLRELGGDAIPKIVGGLLSDRDTVEIAGAMEVVRPELGQFRVREFRVQHIDIPPRLIAPVIHRLRAGQMQTDSLSEDAVGIPLPSSVADVRVSRGKLTFYKATPKR